MSLIDNSSNDYAEPTHEEKCAASKTRIKRMCSNIYQQMEGQHKNVWEMIWNNRRGLSPQDVLDEFGSDAKDLFIFSSSIQAMLYQANPTNYVPLETPLEYTINPNGTVTIATDNPSAE